MSAWDTQIGGNHYKTFKIQPGFFTHVNRLGFWEGCIIKRLVRFDQPTGKGLQDIEKIRHELEILIDLCKSGFYHIQPLSYSYHISPEDFIRENNLSYAKAEIIKRLCSYNNGYHTIKTPWADALDQCFFFLGMLAGEFNQKQEAAQ